METKRPIKHHIENNIAIYDEPIILAPNEMLVVLQEYNPMTKTYTTLDTFIQISNIKVENKQP